MEPGCAGSSTHGVRTSERYGAWAARWASRFVHEAAGAELDEAALVLSALIALRGRARLAAARALEELCELGGQERSATCFAPDGQTFFLNVYEPGMTIAVWGPFEPGGALRRARMARAAPPRALGPLASGDLREAAARRGMETFEAAAYERLGVPLG